MAQIDLTRHRARGAESPLRRLVMRRMFDQGLTLEDVARRGGLSVATVAALRTGGRGKRPRRDTLERLARGLDLSLEDVLAAAAPAHQSPAEELLLQYFRLLDDHDKNQVVAQVATMAGRAQRLAGVQPP